MKRVFLVAGEPSGDIHGASLVRALREADAGVHCEGLGGERMAAAGMTLRRDLASNAIMGFTEVIKHFGPMRRLFLETVAQLRTSPPDCLVLIDYPGFNIRLAKAVSGFGFPIVYYISPQVWAWKKRRIHTIARHVDKMLVIFPFEERLYRDIGMDCVYVGHPLLDHMAEFRPSDRFAGGLVVGVLPGSREQEIRRLLHPMLDVARGIKERYPDARFVTTCVSEERVRQIEEIAGGFPLEVTLNGMYDILSTARFCLVASGTATLQTALFGVPMVILYRVSLLSYLLARLVVDVEHIGIVNILAGKRIAPEFIQGGIKRAEILPIALELMEEGPERTAMLDALASVRESLGSEGASHRAAEGILACPKGVSHA